MYSFLLLSHNILRWLVLAAMIYAIYRSALGLVRGSLFSREDNLVRHWTATTGHIQLIIGVLLLVYSPLVELFYDDFASTINILDLSFFGLIHPLMMILSLIVLTIGSAKAKRRSTDRDKFRTILIYYTISLLIIFIAIPWPGSPFAERPLIRF